MRLLLALVAAGLGLVGCEESSTVTLPTSSAPTVNAACAETTRLASGTTTTTTTTKGPPPTNVTVNPTVTPAPVIVNVPPSVAVTCTKSGGGTP